MAWFGAAPGHYRPAIPGIVSIGGETMGTRWQARFARLDDRGSDDVRGALGAVFERLTAQMSLWRADAWISRYNAGPAGSWHAVPADTAAVLRSALQLARDTDGAFDPTVGPLVDAWGFGAAERRGAPPGSALVDAARASVGWQRLRMDADPDSADGEARLFQPGDIRLDLCGIAKGFAVDRAADRLQALGIADCLVEIGGEWAARGARPDGSAWRIGIEGLAAARPGAAPVGMPLSDAAIATSGDRWHCFAHGGRRYSHTIDPRTGSPIPDRLASVTVVARCCELADALASALAVLGPDDGYRHAACHRIAALFIERGAPAQRIRTTPAFDALLGGGHPR